jgi:tRNA pseudouridine13 synthase
MEETAGPLPDWAFVDGKPAARGVIRSSLEDFRVEEIPVIAPSGEGNHLWLEVEKRGANTNWVAAQLARAAGVTGRDVGYAGMKDRHGVTRQWFSIGLQEAENDDWQSWSIADTAILGGTRHQRKLQRGTLAGNRFRLVVRRVDGDRDELAGRLERVREQGVPNYFGPQRFGHQGRNIPQAAAWLEKGGRIPRNRRSIYLSSIRSFLFNEVLSARVAGGNWNRIVAGDIAMLDGSRSTFHCDDADKDLDERCSAFDIHPTGPLPGAGGKQPRDEAEFLEQRVLAGHRPLIEGLARKGVEASRRSLRLRPAGLEWERDGDALALAFELSPGGYATSVLRELLQSDDVAARSGKMGDSE